MLTFYFNLQDTPHSQQDLYLVAIFSQIENGEMELIPLEKVKAKIFNRLPIPFSHKNSIFRTVFQKSIVKKISSNRLI